MPVVWSKGAELLINSMATPSAVQVFLTGKRYTSVHLIACLSTVLEKQREPDGQKQTIAHKHVVDAYTQAAEQLMPNKSWNTLL